MGNSLHTRLTSLVSALNQGATPPVDGTRLVLVLHGQETAEQTGWGAWTPSLEKPRPRFTSTPFLSLSHFSLSTVLAGCSRPAAAPVDERAEHRLVPV